MRYARLGGPRFDPWRTNLEINFSRQKSLATLADISGVNFVAFVLIVQGFNSLRKGNCCGIWVIILIL